MKKILFVVLLCIVSAGAAFGQKKVAILETIDREGNVPYAIELALRAGLTTGVTGTTGYEGYDRVDLSSVFGEQDFQRTGMVSDEQIHKLGEITGASYVLIAEAAMLDAGNIIITAKIVDVETAKVENSAMKSSSIEALKLEETCNALAMKLLGVNGGAGKSGSVAVSRKPSGGKEGVSSDSGKSDTGLNTDVECSYVEDAYGLGLRMVYVEGGEFMMGGTEEQGKDAQKDEFPVRKVTVGDFYIGQFEITQGQWEKVMKTSFRQRRESKQQEFAQPLGWDSLDKNMREFCIYSYGDASYDNDDYPMGNVSYGDALEFCRVLSKETGKKYRLPTEAEWEYSARGGDNTDKAKYAGGNVMDSVGWSNCNTESGEVKSNNNRDKKTSEAIFKGQNFHVGGMKQANELGIFDMSGNVAEWCSDWYDKTYDEHQTVNPTGPVEGKMRVFRGGSVNSTVKDCRVSARMKAKPDASNVTLGFRVVCEP